jgi:undecaprenyl pyrophosphate synthase
VSVAQFTVDKPVSQHIAIITDGNRRWANQFGLPAGRAAATAGQRIQPDK